MSGGGGLKDLRNSSVISPILAFMNIIDVANSH